MVLIQRCISITKVVNEPAYSGHYRQVVFKTDFTVCILYMFMCVHSSIDVHIYIYMYVHIYICTYICTYTVKLTCMSCIGVCARTLSYDYVCSWGFTEMLDCKVIEL